MYSPVKTAILHNERHESLHRSKDTRTMAEVAALLPWADAINRAFPYALTDGQLAPAVSTLPCPTPASAGADASLQDAIVQSVGTRLVNIVQGALLQLSTVQVWLPEAEPQDAGTSAGCTPEEPAPATETSTKRMRVLKLGNGTLLQVADDEIPDPPAISFVNDIPWLNGMWDDRTEHWQGMSIINIQGHPIAIKYWPLLYCYGHDQQWKGTKNKWTDWTSLSGVETHASHCAIWQFSLGSTWHELVASLCVLPAAISI
ncbi:uncharacterized protein F5147DRAFT_810807 [Suillus discolor]|uniref:Uncharacterized protein n=1 Tax=Suillus discolor TaxID=1912936 RepID=A0A9P7JR19_9AGAM|nr:uncharacterized protein F5147DRAFT_810807 [Suillus discolor]KAG2101838.1 hypothetical protein F5147DRAFT_810807 [Suillus discolor]